jgi:dihydrofolate synthase/folylpolyglutamate synthase
VFSGICAQHPEPPAASLHPQYEEALRFLYGLRWFGAKLGLTNTLHLAELAGHPEKHLRFIHVAGTNGKGSTCAMLESIYRAAGLRVGLFTSPHLLSFRERIQINRQPISQGEVVRGLTSLRPLLRHFSAEHHPTFFEVVTVLALTHFAEQACELVVWETGMGGRLDATNIVTPLASVITNVHFDHEQWLGNALADIAQEKAGIIKPGVPVLTATDAPEALAVIRQVAQQHGSAFRWIGRPDTETPPLDQLRLPLPGFHQTLNAALAAATVRTLRPILPVSEEAILQGLGRVDWPGRLQTVLWQGRTFILDGAHNPGGAAALREALRPMCAPTSLTLILGVLADKDWRAIAEVLTPAAHRVLLVPVSSDRSANPTDLAAACRSFALVPAIRVEVCASLAAAIEHSRGDPVTLIAGSLYLVGEALELLGDSGTGGERALNEWHQPSRPAPSLESRDRTPAASPAPAEPRARSARPASALSPLTIDRDNASGSDPRSS